MYSCLAKSGLGQGLTRCFHHFRHESGEEENPSNPENPACPVKPSFAFVSPG